MDTASKERPSTVPIYSLRTVCARKRTAAHLASLLTNATHSDCRASVRERDGSPLRCYFGNMRGTRVAPSSMLLSYTQPSHDAPLRPITKDLHPPWVNVSALNLPSCLLQPIERKIPSKAFLHDHLTEVIGAYTSSISAYMPTSSASSFSSSSSTIQMLNMNENNESAVASMKEEWHFQLSSLHSSTSQLKAHDIVWMRSLSAPSELLILCLSFICILLQLPPSWTSAKQSILSNGPLLLTFLSQLDPYNIPIGYLKKAMAYYKRHIRKQLPYSSLVSSSICKSSSLTSSSVVLQRISCRPLTILMSWLKCFLPLARKVIQAYRIASNPSSSFHPSLGRTKISSQESLSSAKLERSDFLRILADCEETDLRELHSTVQ